MVPAMHLDPRQCDARARPVAGSQDKTGAALYRFAEELFPWHRSITGEGNRRTLAAIARRLPLRTESIPSGSRAFAWRVPEEWRLQEAFVASESGERLIDYRHSNLHVVSYSQPIDQWMTWSELRPHLFTLPDHPDWVPYRTAYFQHRWGFCLSHRVWQQLESLGERRYQVRIDAEFFAGQLDYGELVIPGRRADEFLIATHICHPSLANDNLSSLAVATELAARLLAQPDQELTVRFLFLPATIGPICWLSRQRRRLSNMVAGLVLSNLGDRGAFTYKRSRREDAPIDRLATRTLSELGVPWSQRRFEPLGYDERQFCSPRFNLPVGRLSRTPNGEYPEYHTSADNLDLIAPASLAESLEVCEAIVRRGEWADSALPEPSWEPRPTAPETYVSRHPWCEPPLGRYRLYEGYGQATNPLRQQAVLWVLNLSDGRHTLSDITRRSRLPETLIREATQRLRDHGLLRGAQGTDNSPNEKNSSDTTDERLSR